MLGIVHALSPIPLTALSTSPHFKAGELNLREVKEIAQGVMLATLVSSSDGQYYPVPVFLLNMIAWAQLCYKASEGRVWIHVGKGKCSP